MGGIYLRRDKAGEFENVAILVTIAVNEDGYREALGVAESMKEDKVCRLDSSYNFTDSAWEEAIWRLAIKCLSMLETMGEALHQDKYQGVR